MTILKMNLTNCLVLMFMSIFIGGGVSSAQETVDESSSKPQTQEENKKQSAKPKEKVFKPSEEISEDLPVPFPIDI